MRPRALLGWILPMTGTMVGLSLGETPAHAWEPPPPLPACIQVGTESRYVPYGYNHVVLLKNGCSQTATCSVSTDVNPQPISTKVATGTTVEVLTYAASPAPTFRARVTCTLP